MMVFPWKWWFSYLIYLGVTIGRYHPSMASTLGLALYCPDISGYLSTHFHISSPFQGSQSTVFTVLFFPILPIEEPLGFWWGVIKDGLLFRWVATGHGFFRTTTGTWAWIPNAWRGTWGRRPWCQLSVRVKMWDISKNGRSMLVCHNHDPYIGDIWIWIHFEDWGIIHSQDP